MSIIWTIEQYHAYLRSQHPEPSAIAHPPPATAPAAPVPDRYRSKTERRYAELLAVWQYEGTIRQWWYEPCKGLYLAPSTSYTPDFLLWYPNGSLVFHEVKGAHIWPKDWIKLKQAAALYPAFTFCLAQWKAGTWRWQPIPAV